MRKSFRLALATALPAVVLVGCSDWLTGDKISDNPNSPSSATAEQLFTGLEVSVMAMWETYPMNLLPLWAQQIAGVTRQWQDYANYISGTDASGASETLWNQMYGGGGLADNRRVDSATTESGNLVFRGENRVLEALIVGTAADIFGDVPFSQAGFTSIPKPQFDAQADVYAHVLALLDSAIADMASGQGAGAGTADVMLGNDPAKWTAVAHTLKARFYMHTSRGADSTARFAAALAEAQLGIRTATGGPQVSSPNYDLQAVHTSNTGEANLFYEFLIGPRAGDVEPSAIHIDALESTGNDLLLPVFYIPNSSGEFVGANAGITVPGVSSFAITASTPTGIVTYAENELILAEAQYRLGDQTGALNTLNAFRASVGAPAATVPGVPNGLLVAILLEKFSRLFINPEVYFDYLRTCVPNVPFPAAPSPDFPYMPARLPYGYTETISNPDEPHIQNEPSGNLANANFPKNLTDPTGATCIQQVNRPGP